LKTISRHGPQIPMERFAFFADQNAAVSFLRHPESKELTRPVQGE
jgi:hypothetical protein